MAAYLPPSPPPPTLSWGSRGSVFASPSSSRNSLLSLRFLQHLRTLVHPPRFLQSIGFSRQSSKSSRPLSFCSLVALSFLGLVAVALLLVHVTPGRAGEIGQVEVSQRVGNEATGAGLQQVQLHLQGQEQGSASGYFPEWPEKQVRPLGIGRRRDPQDTCWSRTERALYYQELHNGPSAAFRKRVEDYLAMTKRCREGVTDWVKFFYGERSERPPTSLGCQYLLYLRKDNPGIGNHLMSLVSNFVYALLTDRVLLVGEAVGNENSQWILRLEEIFCDPFAPATSMWIDPTQNDELVKKVRTEQRLAGVVEKGEAPQRLYMYLPSHFRPMDWNFFCNSTQETLSRVEIIAVYSDANWATALWLVPLYEKQLATLFPDRMPYTHVARFFLHPLNSLWERITALYEEHVRDATLVGFQLRTKMRDKEDYEDVNSKILECAVSVMGLLPPVHSVTNSTQGEEALLPDGNQQVAATDTSVPSSGFISRLFGAFGWRSGNDEPFRTKSPTYSVFIASLHKHHYDHISTAYSSTLTAAAENGSVKEVFTLSAMSNEDHTREQITNAIVEMFLLSLSAELFISYESTFGYVAAALAGYRPILLNINHLAYKNKARPICERGPTSEPCFHRQRKQLFCRDSAEHDVADLGPAYTDTLAECIDYRSGMVVLSRNDPLPVTTPEATSPSGLE
eukprot:TRINITY_DN6792_c0_g3_i1.p1 TRINITY_DN6792_c0_g3~~TRINITY_DN6792_c0_g3_i1.p1  ORF type:complete len:681 (-),score=77.30 TRINITY_DN6792_c0_g3_i1:158-2200(-)